MVALDASAVAQKKKTTRWLSFVRLGGQHQSIPFILYLNACLEVDV